MAGSASGESTRFEEIVWEILAEAKATDEVGGLGGIGFRIAGRMRRCHARDEPLVSPASAGEALFRVP
jgi:hypothetical protein